MASNFGAPTMSKPRTMAAEVRRGGAVAQSPNGVSAGGARGVPMGAARASPAAAPPTPQHQTLGLPQKHQQHIQRQGQREAQDRGEVAEFLKQAGLDQYTTHFLRSGFEDMETLQVITDADMRDMGLPAFHIVRMRKRLQEIQRESDPANWAYDANHPVVQFMEEIGLGQYVEPLMRGGFDDLDVLCDMEDSDMKDLGIPRGHALKLRKRLRDYQLDVCQYLEDGDSQPQPHRAGTAAGHRQTPQSRKLASHIGPVSLHMPTDQMKSAVERSWEQVESLGTFAVGEILHRSLFRLMPEAIQLFPSHVRTKYREWSSDEACDESNIFESPALRKLFSKFVNAVGCAVAGLHDNARLVPMLLQLGQRHVNYGVRQNHFDALGRAFSLTLHEILGADFTKEVDDAWSTAYKFMTSIMMEGMSSARPVFGGKKTSTGSTVSTMQDSGFGGEGFARALEDDIDEDEEEGRVESAGGPSALISAA